MAQALLSPVVARDDRILRETRWVAALVVPFLVAAVGILYVFPGNTAEMFAWTIRPDMTPLLMGAGYSSGIYFFSRVVRARQWHTVAIGFLPVATFAATMLAATLLHWDRFNHSHVSFYTWLIIYIVTPILVFAVWYRNRHADPGTADAGEQRISPTTQRVLGVIGVALLLIATAMFVAPALIMPMWPWQLTPLTARVGAGWLAMPGVFAVLMAREERWSAIRISVESLLVALVLVLIGAIRAWGDFNPASPFTWLFVGGIALSAVALVALYLRMERRA